MYTMVICKFANDCGYHCPHKEPHEKIGSCSSESDEIRCDAEVLIEPCIPSTIENKSFEF